RVGRLRDGPRSRRPRGGRVRRAARLPALECPVRCGLRRRIARTIGTGDPAVGSYNRGMLSPSTSAAARRLATLLMFVACAQFARAQDAREAITARWQEIGNPKVIYLAPSPYSPAPAGRKVDKAKAGELTSLARRAAEAGEAALAIRLATE